MHRIQQPVCTVDPQDGLNAVVHCRILGGRSDSDSEEDKDESGAHMATAATADSEEEALPYGGDLSAARWCTPMCRTCRERMSLISKTT